MSPILGMLAVEPLIRTDIVPLSSTNLPERDARKPELVEIMPSPKVNPSSTATDVPGVTKSPAEAFIVLATGQPRMNNTDVENQTFS